MEVRSVIEILSVIKHRDGEILKILFKCSCCGNIFPQLTDKNGCILICRYIGECEHRGSAVVDIVAWSDTQCSLKVDDMMQEFDIYIPEND
jgi:hypothetical protein